LVGQVFGYWVSKREKSKAKLTAQRKRKIEGRLREGYTVEDLCKAIDGVAYSKHHRGENDEGRVWDDLELICRDGSHVEMFRDMPRNRSSPGPPAKRDDVAKAEDYTDQAFYGRRLDN